MLSGYRGSITKPPPGTPIDPFHPLSQGLVGYWLMNEGSGSRAYDISGHGNHGTLTGMSTNAQNSGWGGSKFGGGLSFDGSDDHIVMNDIDLNHVSVCAWVNIKDAGKYNTILSNDYEYGLIADPDTQIRFYVRNAAGSYPYAWKTISAFDNKFHFFVGTWDGTNIEVYLDGVKGTAEPLGGTLNEYNPSSVMVGRSPDWFGDVYNLDGLVDFAIIYNRALSAAEVRQLYEDPFCNLLRVPVRYVPAAPAAAIMNQFQKANMGADLYNGALSI